MGVEDLEGMDTPQMTGGRPKGSTVDKDDGMREYDGDPYTKDDGDEYWEEVWELNHTREGSIRVDVMNTAQHTSCLPRTVVENLHNRGIFSFEELAEDPPEWMESHLESLQLEGINTRFAPDPDTGGKPESSSGLSKLVSGDTDDEDDEDEPSDGLQSLL